MALQKVRRTPGRRGASQPPRSRAFFLELLLNMLIFALCAIVALQVFVEGKLSSDHAAALSHLTLDAEALAEDYKALEGSYAALELRGIAGESSEASAEADGVVFYYTKDFELTSKSEAYYSLSVAPAEGTHELVSVARITGFDGEEELFSFEVSAYQPQGGR